MKCTAGLVCLISTVNGRIKKRSFPWKTGASCGHITNLKQSILVFQYLWGAYPNSNNNILTKLFLTLSTDEKWPPDRLHHDRDLLAAEEPRGFPDALPHPVLWKPGTNAIKRFCPNWPITMTTLIKTLLIYKFDITNMFLFVVLSNVIYK
jgi:hypothetical protein